VPFQRFISFWIVVSFFLTTLVPLPKAHGSTEFTLSKAEGLTTGADSVLGLPAPGTMVNLSPAYQPVIIKGLTVHKDNPFLFDFIVDIGQDRMSGEPLKKEGEKLIKYFLASLAIPDKDVWVNLSPYEKNRMIPEALSQTDMGRDLLEQDYILKQITASLIYPEKQLGKVFWDRVYKEIYKQYSDTPSGGRNPDFLKKIPVNVGTFNKVWIMADRAEVFEHNQTAFVVDCHLKVMLEEDYLALSKHRRQPGDMALAVSPSRLPSEQRVEGESTPGKSRPALPATNSIASQIVKQIILPQLEKEVNTGKNFANLRQIFNSVILSSWYKKNLKEALLNQVYANRSKIKGIERQNVNPAFSTVIPAKAGIQNIDDINVIYEQYLKAYKKGVFNYIKEDVNAASGQTMPRKYFSGGTVAAVNVVIDDAMTGEVKMRKQNWYGEMLFTTGLETNHSPAAQTGNPNSAMNAENPPFVNDVLDRLALVAQQDPRASALIRDMKEKYLAENADKLRVQIDALENIFNATALPARDKVLADKIIFTLKVVVQIKDILQPQNKPEEEVSFDEAVSWSGKEIVFFDRNDKDLADFRVPRLTNVPYPDLNLLQRLSVTGLLSTLIWMYNHNASMPFINERKNPKRYYSLLWSIAESYHLISRPAPPASKINAAMTVATQDRMIINRVTLFWLQEHGVTNINPDDPKRIFLKRFLSGEENPQVALAFLIPFFDIPQEVMRISLTAAWISAKYDLYDNARKGVEYSLSNNKDAKEKGAQMVEQGTVGRRLDESIPRILEETEKVYKEMWPNAAMLTSEDTGELNLERIERIIRPYRLFSENAISSAAWIVRYHLQGQLSWTAAVDSLVEKAGITKSSKREEKVAIRGRVETMLDGIKDAVMRSTRLYPNEALAVIWMLNSSKPFSVWDLYSQASLDNTTPDKISLLLNKLFEEGYLKRFVNQKYEVNPEKKVELSEMTYPSNLAYRDRAMATATGVSRPGGIDLNTSSGMQWRVSKDGKGVEMNVSAQGGSAFGGDPAMIERIKREGIDSLSPVIFRITPVASIWPLVGLEA